MLPAAMIIMLAGCTETPKAAITPPVSPKPVQTQPQSAGSAPTGTVTSAPTRTVTSAPTGTVTSAPTGTPAVFFAYNPAGRRDPFAPIIVKQIKGLAANRPPLERYNISEFKLSGIIWGGFGYNAMLEGPDGKGYFIRVGTILGPNRGVVKKITQTMLVVEEKFKSYTGQTERKEIIVELRKKQEATP